MDLKTALLEEHSKRQNQRIVTFIGRDQKKFDILLQLLLDNDPIIAQRASWAVSECVLKHTSFLEKHLGSLLNHLARKDLHNAIKRNSMRALQYIEIRDEQLGRVANLCFQYLQSRDEAIAVKAISIKLLSKICKNYPELKKEFIPLLDHMILQSTPAIISCIRSAQKEI